MVEQLTGLAPEGALGYRLLMPTRTPDDMPRLSPPLDATGYQGHYSLCPFQAPYDIRLMDGQTYRVVWIGASGEIISPKTAGTIPGLHFFLTSSVSSLRTEAESSSCGSVAAGTESVKTEGSRSVTQTEVDTQRDGTPVLDPKQTTEALTLDEKLHAALGEKPIELIMPRIELLLCARQFQEARLLAEQMLAVSPLDLNSLTAAATASQECGDYASAESYLRRQYQVALDSFRIDLFVDTVEQLIVVLGTLGKDEECSRLNQMFGNDGFLAHGRRLIAEVTAEPESSTSATLSSSPPAVVVPPPSRNQPCPCKSGKRYRHCCRPKGPQSAVSSAGSTK